MPSVTFISKNPTKIKRIIVDKISSLLGCKAFEADLLSVKVQDYVNWESGWINGHLKITDAENLHNFQMNIIQEGNSLEIILKDPVRNEILSRKTFLEVEYPEVVDAIRKHVDVIVERIRNSGTWEKSKFIRPPKIPPRRDGASNFLSSQSSSILDEELLGPSRSGLCNGRFRQPRPLTKIPKHLS